MKNLFLKYAAGCALAVLAGGLARGAQVSEADALALAEWWYATEINSPNTDLTPAERQARIAARGRNQVQYVLGRDKVQRGRNADEAVLAYVVTFEPSGFVVVAGDDALQPLLAFNATGTFRWDNPEHSYQSHFVGRAVAGAAQRHRAAAQRGQAALTHTNWTRLRTRMAAAPLPGGAAPGGVGGADTPGGAGSYVVLPTALWGQGDHYNEVCRARCGEQNVPTGCTATAMAIKFRYHEWPPHGFNSHAYADFDGSVRAAHSVDFSQHTYNWSAMPTNVLTADNAQVAQLMYDCGVAVDMDYEVDASGAWPSTLAMTLYFAYRGTVELSSGAAAVHLPLMAYSIQCGLPAVMSSTAHTVVACGYRDDVGPHFFLNTGWDGSSCDWYDLDLMPGGDDSIDRSYACSSPVSYTYVDGEYTGLPNGDLLHPFQTLAGGQAEVLTDGVLLLKAGHYTGAGNTITLNKPMELRSYLGAATIGE